MNPQALGYKAGLRVSDRLLSVNSERCTDPTQTATMLKAAEGKITLEIVRLHDEASGTTNAQQPRLAIMSIKFKAGGAISP